MRGINQITLFSALSALALTLQAGPVFAAKAYDGHVTCEGKNCQVDLFLLRGFRAFSQCQVCHGIDGDGSSFAPGLNDKILELDRMTFDDRVANGFKGQVGVMPPWKANPNVMKYLDNLYAYLQARADKVIPPGRLKRYDRGEKGMVTGEQLVGMSGMGGMGSMGGEAIAKDMSPAAGVFGSRGNLKQGR